MALLIEKPQAVILAVDVHQLGGQLPQLRRRNRNAAHPGGGLALRCDFALKDQLTLIGNVILLQPGQLPVRRENGCDQAAGGALAHQFPAGAVAQHGVDGIDNDGFTCTRLTAEDIQPLVKDDIRPFDHGDVFNMQFT